VHSRIDVDEQTQRRRDRVHRGRVLAEDGETGVGPVHAQGGQPPDRGTDQRIGQQDVGPDDTLHPQRLEQDARLAGRGTLEVAHAGAGQLREDARDLRALDVGPPAPGVAAHRGQHVAQIVAHPIEVDDQGRTEQSLDHAVRQRIRLRAQPIEARGDHRV
jgi:hypothetical protein